MKRKLVDVTDLLSKGEVSFMSLVDHVAKEMINADLDGFGHAWPWPEGNEEWAVKTRMAAREAAKVAIKAFLSWPNQIVEEKDVPEDPADPKYTRTPEYQA